MRTDGRLLTFLIVSLIVILAGVISIVTQKAHPLVQFIGVVLLIIPVVAGAIADLSDGTKA